MTQIDPKALEAAYEASLTSYNTVRERAEATVRAYLSALPPPPGDVGELVKRLLEERCDPGPTSDPNECELPDNECECLMRYKTATALASLSARLSEVESERDAAVEAAAVEFRNYQAATAQAGRLEAALREARIEVEAARSFGGGIYGRDVRPGIQNLYREEAAKRIDAEQANDALSATPNK